MSPSIDLHPSSDPAANLVGIKEALHDALREAGRPLDAVTITAVSKTFDIDIIRPALVAGHRVFGENRIQEAVAKWPVLRSEFSDIELRLIGPLQSKKAKDAVAHFDVIETVDREKIAAVLADEMARQDRQLPIYVQINTGEEPQKSGILPADADRFIALCRDQYGHDLRGLMCIPPIGEVPAPHFSLLEKIARRNGLTALSMGMSSDFCEAAQLGATHIRVGTGVFGRRVV